MTVIPDSIEPVEQWRSWKFVDGHLVSLNHNTVWGREPLVAKCETGDGLRWTIKRGSSVTLAAACERSTERNHSISRTYHFGPPPPFLEEPKVEPPPGYGYALVTKTHEAPQVGCTCGIYAVESLEDCPKGDVVGKVKLWGTIIPGTKGSRAQYAYPSELHVPKKLADDPGLLAYGVPIVVRDSAVPQVAVFASNYQTARRFMWSATGLNLAALTMSLLHIAKVY